MKSTTLKNIVAISGVALCGLCSSTQAASLNGVFVSVGGGVRYLQANSDIATTLSNSGSSVIFTANSNNHATNDFGRLGVGYGWYRNNIYLGAELAYDFYNSRSLQSSGKTTAAKSSPYNYQTAYSDTVKMPNQFEASAIFGYQWPRQILSFIRVGYVNAALHYSNHIGWSANGGLNGETSGSNNSRVNGVLFGLGARLPVAKHISLSAEYDFTLYAKPHLNTKSTMSVPQPKSSTAIVDWSTDINYTSLNSSTGLVSLIYTF